MPAQRLGQITQRREAINATLTEARTLVRRNPPAALTLLERALEATPAHSDLTRMLTEQNLQASDLVSDAQRAARFGEVAGVRYIITGSINRFGELNIAARLIDVETARIERMAKTHQRWRTMRGSAATRTVARSRWVRNRRTPGACTTCTGTCGNGALTGLAHTLEVVRLIM